MKFVHPYYFDPIIIEDTDPETLVIENNRYFRSMTADLLEQYNNDYGDFVLSEGNDLLNLAKTTAIITDPFSIDFNSRTLKSKLLQILSSECAELNYMSVISDLNRLGFEISSGSKFSLTFKSELTLTDLLKFLDFQIDHISLDPIESLLEYISLSSELLNKSLIITYGIKDILTFDEYSEFEKSIKYKHLKLLLVEHRCHRSDDPKHRRIIDEDLCVI